jgi:hypothetical protein
MTMQHRDGTRGDRNAHWIEKYCLYPTGPDKGKRVTLTPTQRAVVHAIYDYPNGPHQLPATGPLAAYLALLHVCGPEGTQRDFRPDVSADIFTVWGAVSPELRRVLELDGGTILCPALGTRYPPVAA